MGIFWKKTTIRNLKELCSLVAKVKQIYAIPMNDFFFLRLFTLTFPCVLLNQIPGTPALSILVLFSISVKWCFYNSAINRSVSLLLWFFFFLVKDFDLLGFYSQSSVKFDYYMILMWFKVNQALNIMQTCVFICMDFFMKDPGALYESIILGIVVNAILF